MAGDAYRERVNRFEKDPDFGPDVLLEKIAEANGALKEWKYGDDDGLGPISDEHARFYAAIQRPSGPQLLAFETGADVVLDQGTVTYDEALDYLFGETADANCAKHAIIIDAETRTKLLREIAKVVRLAGEKLARNMDGDYSDDPNITRFPVFERAVGNVLGSIYQIGIDALSQPWHGRHPNR